MTRRPPYPRTDPRPWQESPAQQQQQRTVILEEYRDIKTHCYHEEYGDKKVRTSESTSKFKR